MTADYEGEVPREQVEIALEILEAFHGNALDRRHSGEASAYYHAIGIVEDALDEAYDLDHEPHQRRWEEDLKRSRAAREEGYREATLLGRGRTKVVENRVVKRDEPGDDSLFAAIRGLFT